MFDRKRIGVAAFALALLGAALPQSGVAVATARLGSNPLDQRTADRAQVRLSDLPPGWATAKSKVTNGSARCLTGGGVKPTGSSSRVFVKGDSVTALALVGVYALEAQAKKAFARLKSARVWGCLAGELKKRSDAGRIPPRPYVRRKVVAMKGRAVFVFFHVAVPSSAMTRAEESLLVRRVTARLP